MQLNTPEQTAAMAARIKERMDELGLAPNSVGNEGSGSRDQVRNIFRAVKAGKSYNPRGDTLRRIAYHLEVTLDWLLYGTGEKFPEYTKVLVETEVGPSSPSPLSVRRAGKVEAGAFRPVDIDPEEDPYVPIAADPRFPLAQQYAWEVVGDSMDAVGIQPGMTVLGVDFHGYEKHYDSLRDGQLVVVEALRDDGREREVTVKEARIYRDRTELVPRSKNPTHQPIVLQRGQGFDDLNGHIRIIAIVLDARRVFI